ncbi:MAG: hypothetical protein U1B78_03210 [Dehalococcoidia bacterium]|nr:hypothetical protein [Dehalococcoidia bacterium]
MLLLAAAVVMLAAACEATKDNEEPDETAEPTATADATETPEPAATNTPTREATATSVPAAPTQPPLTNRQSCAAIQGTPYLSEEEHQWYLSNCSAPPPPQQPPAQQPPGQTCHPSYVGACLDPNASDYDCAGGSGNGPLYTGPVQVVGPDVFDLDSDNDGFGCE